MLCIGNLNHLFFCPELYRRTREPSSARAFSENPGVALFGWLEREQRDVIGFLREETVSSRRSCTAGGCGCATTNGGGSLFSANAAMIRCSGITLAVYAIT
jgi:hypothetical protein